MSNISYTSIVSAVAAAHHGGRSELFVVMLDAYLLKIRFGTQILIRNPDQNPIRTFMMVLGCSTKNDATKEFRASSTNSIIPYVP